MVSKQTDEVAKLQGTRANEVEESNFEAANNKRKQRV
jgi:hypothetical protein